MQVVTIFNLEHCNYLLDLQQLTQDPDGWYVTAQLLLQQHIQIYLMSWVIDMVQALTQHGSTCLIYTPLRQWVERQLSQQPTIS
jgi:hypothetical protein